MSELKLNDSGVVFKQDEHRYFLGDKELQGVTSTLIRRAFPGMYSNIPQQVLDRAAERGSTVHGLIELFNSIFGGNRLSFPAESWTPELRSYVGIVKTNKLKHIASEYVVTDKEHYASAIDGVYLNSNDGIVLVDYKTTSQLYYENVALQLSIYAKFFELVNPKLKVASIACIWLRGDKSKYVELSRIDDETVDKLIAADLNDDDSYVYTPDIPNDFYSLQLEYARLARQIDDLTEQQLAVKDKILELMQEHKAKSYKTALGSFTYVPASSVKRFDSKLFKEQHQDIYDEYSKATAPQLRIKLKKKKQWKYKEKS